MPGLRSPLAVVALNTVDVSAPGAPSLAATQTSNSVVSVVVSPPATDADGTPLTGLSTYTVGLALANEDGTSPFTDSASFESVASGITTVAVSADGSPVSLTLPILVLGRQHYVAAYATD